MSLRILLKVFFLKFLHHECTGGFPLSRKFTVVNMQNNKENAAWTADDCEKILNVV